MADNKEISEKKEKKSLKVPFEKIAYSGTEAKTRAINGLVSDVKSSGHCRLANDMLERIGQNIHDFKEIVAGVSAQNNCSQAQAFREIWPYYRRAFFGLIVRDPSWSQLTPKHKKVIKGKTLNLFKQFSAE